MSLGLGLVFVPLFSTALHGVHEAESGVASAFVNTTQEVGGSVGTALLNTVAASTAATYVMKHGADSARAAAVHGYTSAFAVGAAFVGLAAVLVVLLVDARHDDQPV
jgi:hypothetical protein